MHKHNTLAGAQPIYYSLDELVDYIPGANGDACRRMYADHKELFNSAPGASHNHQVWPGGYADHVTDAMNTAMLLYNALSAARPLPFELSDALLVVFLHDLEKPFKYKQDDFGVITKNPEFPNKAANSAKRKEVIEQYGIVLSPSQANALRYVEVVNDAEYTPNARIMGELASLCHCADTLSARLWYNYPAPKGQDEWQGAGRVSAQASSFSLPPEDFDSLGQIISPVAVDLASSKSNQ
jgi:hypothetical protein